MTRAQRSIQQPPNLAIAMGAATPTASIGSTVWSTTEGRHLSWTGTSWQPTQDLLPFVDFTTRHTATQPNTSGYDRLQAMLIGRPMIAWMPNGADVKSPAVPLQPSLWFRGIHRAYADAGTATVSEEGMSSSIVGTGYTYRQNAPTVHAVEYRSDTGFTDIATWRPSTDLVHTGDGFFVAMRAGWSAIDASSRVFLGLVAANALTSDVNPTTAANVVGVLANNADANLSFYTSGASAGTKTAITPSIAKTATTFRDFVFHQAPGALSVTFATRLVQSGAAWVSTVYTPVAANYPTNQWMRPVLFASTGGTYSSVYCRLSSAYIESSFG